MPKRIIDGSSTSKGNCNKHRFLQFSLRCLLQGSSGCTAASFHLSPTRYSSISVRSENLQALGLIQPQPEIVVPIFVEPLL